MRGSNGADGGFTRRQVISRGGVLFGTLGVGPGLLAPSRAAASGLPPNLRATYVALVEAVGAAPGSGVDRSRAELAATRFEEILAKTPTSGRACVRRVLETIDSADSGAPFSDKPVADRLRLLREWQRSGDGFKIDAASSAAALASRPAYPDVLEHPQSPVNLGGAA